jgi:hypothetical protein
MDLALYIRVLWRFKVIVIAGFVLAIGLAFLSVKTISFSGGSISVTPRKAQVWKTDSYLLVTQTDFPWGRTVPRYAPGNPRTGAPATAKGDPQRLATLTAVYSQIALNDKVRAKLPGPDAGKRVSVSAVPAPPYSTPAIQPILDFAATGPTPAKAAALGQSAASAFTAWLKEQQGKADTPRNDRVLLVPYTKVTPPVLLSSSGKTLPVIVFLTIFGATIGLALVLENLRPRPVAVPADELHPPVSEREQRKSA